MFSRSAATVAAAAILLTMAAGCASKKKPGEIRITPGSENVLPSGSSATAGKGSGSTSTSGAAGSGTAASQGAGGGMGDGASSGAGSLQGGPGWPDGTAPAGKPSSDLANIYFDFDSYELNDAAKAVISRNVEYLKKNPKIRVVLRGHTDTRGTPEYNYALGERRAQTVREALVAAGLSVDRLETMSFGEDLPATVSGDDVDEARNRRVEFFIFEMP